MNKYFKRISYALIMTSMLNVFAACDDDNESDDITDPQEFMLKGELTSEKILKSGKTYELIGGYQVKAGGDLIIEPGVTINATRSIDGQPDYIIIEQGGKIHAEGTKEKPIVMTSTRQQSGSWGGVHICGNAPINLSGGTGKSEIGDATFGGANPTDNSGIMRYVRLEYTGFAFSETKESNGLTMYGVGSGTNIEYVQVYKGSDDGFEWFGGTVNGKYLVSTHSEDDSFDWTDGWVGKGQFWVAIQDQTAPGEDGTANGDCLIEADNREDNFGNTPQSCPTLANLTLVGNNDSNKQKRGIRLRAGTAVNIYNTLVVGKPSPVTVATAETEQSFLNGTSSIEYLWTNKTFSYESISDLALDSKTGNGINQTINFSSGYLGTVEGGKDLSADKFFTKAEYKGAVPANNDWTAGWTRK
ncbi:hypothetical protein [Parabacteroides sp. PF5-9]|uniref:hypothetical protein n=1 Tax=Parabacteroides sp. PF5-9 TaxID=1742404 RepID=UPI0024740D04|nr:hypothetical protein [Parabacteroides sp. PF5-9]MDH6356830.1 hypothetical protein [Parabacteroides sp. PF5-9]